MGIWGKLRFPSSAGLAPSSTWSLCPEVCVNALSAWEQKKSLTTAWEFPSCPSLCRLYKGTSIYLLHFQGHAGGSVHFGLSGEGHSLLPWPVYTSWSFLPLITNEAMGGGFPCFLGSHAFLLSAFSTFLPGKSCLFLF